MVAEDWVYLPDGEGQHYYANLSSGQSTWERPPELDAPAGASGGTKKEPRRGSMRPAASKDRWVEYMDEEHGQPYYYNEVTGESAWFIPADEDDDVESDGEAEAEADVQKESAGEEEEARRAAEKREKRAARRLKILDEILSTEQSYVAALRTVTRVYVEPLRMVAGAKKGAIFSHDDLDAIFLNITVITKVNEKFLEELQAEQAKGGDVNYAECIKEAAKKFKGCYTRYVNNFDEAEAKLKKISTSDAPGDREKHRYLVGAAKHPDARGLDLRSLLIQPVQRVPRYRMLLEDLLKHTDDGHPECEPLREALDRVCEVAKSFNEDKRVTDEFAKLRTVFDRFCDSDAATLRADLLSYERRLVKEGSLIKVRLSHRQKRNLLLFNDVLLYATTSLKGELVLKGRIGLHDGARVESLPSTEESPYALAIVAKGGKGYTWLAESAEEKSEWVTAIKGAIALGKRASVGASARELLEMVKSKPLQARIFVVQGGCTLIKYNKRDGKSNPRWVYVTLDKLGAGEAIKWGDPKTKDCKSEAKLQEATALLHGAKSSAFFKQQGTKKDQDWQCFSVVFKERHSLKPARLATQP